MRKMLLPAAIILLAAFFRCYRLNELPPGLHYDEAFNAVQAQKVLAGVERPLYFTEDLTEEPMAIYTASVFFWLFGPSPFSLRLVSAFVGILTVAALYFFARAFTPTPRESSRIASDAFEGLGAPCDDSRSLPGRAGEGERVWVLAAFILAILYWHINFSRLGMEPIFLPLLLTLGVGFLVRAFRPLPSPLLTKGRAWMGFALAGLFLALTLYTYKAALFVPIFIGGYLASEIIFNRDWLVRNWRGLGIFLAAAVLAFAPLGLYWAAHPGQFIERPSTVLAAPATIFDNAIKVGAMFFWHGDENPRSNLPGRAALDPLLAIGFIAGIIACLTRFRRVAPRVMLIWLIAMVLPSVFTDFAPHFGRSIAATPAIAFVTAYGFDAILVRAKHSLKQSFPRIKSTGGSRILGRLGLANPSPLHVVLVLGLAFSTFSTFNDYFNVWGTRTGRFDSFDVGLLSLAQKLRMRPPNESLFLTPVERDHYTIQFGLNGADANSFDGSRALVLPEPGPAAAYGIVTQNDARTLARLRKIFPTGRAVETIYDFAGQPYAVIFRVEGAGQWMPQKRIDARLGENIALIGYDAARTGNEIALTIYWGSIAETHADYTVFVHLLDPSGRVIAQDDAQPGHRSYPTSRWRAGHVIADDYRLTIPPEARATPSAFQVEIGMYVLETGARIRMTDANGAQMENDRVLIERFAFP